MNHSTHTPIRLPAFRIDVESPARVLLNFPSRGPAVLLGACIAWAVLAGPARAAEPAVVDPANPATGVQETKPASAPVVPSARLTPEILPGSGTGSTNPPPAVLAPPVVTPSATPPAEGKQPGVEPAEEKPDEVGNTFIPTLPVIDSEATGPAIDPGVVTPGMQGSTFERLSALPSWMQTSQPGYPDWLDVDDFGLPYRRPGLGTSIFGGASPSGALRRPASAPVQLGPVDLWARLEYEFSYGDGLLSRGRDSEGSFLNTVYPAMTLAVGDHWTIAYSPTVRFYSTEGYRDTVNQAISLGWQSSWRRWQFGLRHAVTMIDDPLVETGRQTEQTTHVTSLTASCNSGQRGQLGFVLSESIRETPRFTSAYSWSLQSSYDHRLGSKLSAGLVFGVGYDMMDPGTDMANNRLNLRVRGSITRKLVYEIGGGAEIRYFYGLDAPAALSPVVRATLSYALLQRTSMSLGFSHDVGTSYYSDQYTESSSFQGTLTQLLGTRWSVSAAGGYQTTGYQRPSARTVVAREDSTVFSRAELSLRLSGRLSTSVFYSYRSNISDRDSFSFDSNEMGLRLRWSL